MTQDEVFKKAAPLIAKLVLEHRAKKAAESPSAGRGGKTDGDRGQQGDAA